MMRRSLTSLGVGHSTRPSLAKFKLPCGVHVGVTEVGRPLWARSLPNGYTVPERLYLYTWEGQETVEDVNKCRTSTYFLIDFSQSMQGYGFQKPALNAVITACNKLHAVSAPYPSLIFWDTRVSTGVCGPKNVKSFVFKLVSKLGHATDPAVAFDELLRQLTTVEAGSVVSAVFMTDGEFNQRDSYTEYFKEMAAGLRSIVDAKRLQVQVHLVGLKSDSVEQIKVLHGSLVDIAKVEATYTTIEDASNISELFGSKAMAAIDSSVPAVTLRNATSPTVVTIRADCHGVSDRPLHLHLPIEELNRVGAQKDGPWSLTALEGVPGASVADVSTLPGYDAAWDAFGGIVAEAKAVRSSADEVALRAWAEAAVGYGASVASVVQCVRESVRKLDGSDTSALELFKTITSLGQRVVELPLQKLRDEVHSLVTNQFTPSILQWCRDQRDEYFELETRVQEMANPELSEKLRFASATAAMSSAMAKQFRSASRAAVRNEKRSVPAAGFVTIKELRGDGGIVAEEVAAKATTLEFDSPIPWDRLNSLVPVMGFDWEKADDHNSFLIGISHLTLSEPRRSSKKNRARSATRNHASLQRADHAAATVVHLLREQLKDPILSCVPKKGGFKILPLAVHPVCGKFESAFRLNEDVEKGLGRLLTDEGLSHSTRHWRVYCSLLGALVPLENPLWVFALESVRVYLSTDARAPLHEAKSYFYMTRDREPMSLADVVVEIAKVPWLRRKTCGPWEQVTALLLANRNVFEAALRACGGCVEGRNANGAVTSLTTVESLREHCWSNTLLSLASAIYRTTYTFDSDDHVGSDGVRQIVRTYQLTAAPGVDATVKDVYCGGMGQMLGFGTKGVAGPPVRWTGSSHASPPREVAQLFTKLLRMADLFNAFDDGRPPSSLAHLKPQGELSGTPTSARPNALELYVAVKSLDVLESVVPVLASKTPDELHAVVIGGYAHACTHSKAQLGVADLIHSRNRATRYRQLPTGGDAVKAFTSTLHERCVPPLRFSEDAQLAINNLFQTVRDRRGAMSVSAFIDTFRATCLGDAAQQEVFDLCNKYYPHVRLGLTGLCDDLSIMPVSALPNIEWRGTPTPEGRARLLGGLPLNAITYPLSTAFLRPLPPREFKRTLWRLSRDQPRFEAPHEVSAVDARVSTSLDAATWDNANLDLAVQRLPQGPFRDGLIPLLKPLSSYHQSIAQ